MLVVQPVLNAECSHSADLGTPDQTSVAPCEEHRDPASLNVVECKQDKKKTMCVFSDRLHVWQRSRWWGSRWTAKSAAWFISLRPPSASMVSTCAILLLGGGDIVSWFSLDCCLTTSFILCSLSFFSKEWCVHWLFSAHLVKKIKKKPLQQLPIK